MAEYFTNKLTGIILAGGKSTRMQGVDKGLTPLNGTPLVEHVIHRLQPQTTTIVINANNHITDYENFGFPIVEDRMPGHPGPLAGIAACMTQAKTEYILCVPCDAPRLPLDLGNRLYQVLTENQAELAYAHDGDRSQPLFALMHRQLLGSINDYLASDQYKVDAWYHQHQYVVCDFSDKSEDFLNINSVEELQKVADQYKISE
ncbi:MAG: molybdenum cofactor guanylyltransferase [Gammaproteobacteria bacterium]|nr:molybdenum cofactor guanylyltransferase [Gammaproteobacteria bacterium]